MNVLLVIAENRAVCETLRAILPKSDLLIFEATIHDAGRRLVSLQADAILLDDGPRLGGDALPALKTIAPGVPVIVLSARGDLVTQASLTRAGAAHVIVKPFRYEDLSAALDKMTGTPTFAPLQPAPETPAASRRALLNQHQMALRWISRVSMHGSDPKQFSQRLVESAEDIFDTARCSVLLEVDDGVRVIASQGVSNSIVEPLCLGYSTGLMRWFDENACLIDRRNISDSLDPRIAASGRDALKELQLLGGRLAAPLMRNGRVCGAVILGEKVSGLDYSPEERELLTLVARTTSTALERSGVRTNESARSGAMQNAFAEMPAGVIVIGSDKKILQVNPEAEALLEIHARDIAGQSVQKLGSAFADIVLRCLQDGQSRVQQKIHDAATGAHLEISVRPMERGGVVVLFKTAPEASAAAADIAYSPFWEYLSSRVAQEIKNPMVAINTFAQLLPRKYDSEDFREAFGQVVQKEVQRINGVVETLFEFARNPRLTLERCNLNATVESILKSFEEELLKNAITLETQWGGDVDSARIDPIFFSQALHNVVQNSIEAMSTGGRLTVSTHKDIGQFEIRVADTGPGVAPEDADRIFLPFYSTKERGMGLGLPLANRILHQHHGELRLVANGETGSCFALRIPAETTGANSGAAPEGSHADHSGD